MWWSPGQRVIVHERVLMESEVGPVREVVEGEVSCISKYKGNTTSKIKRLQLTGGSMYLCGD